MWLDVLNKAGAADGCMGCGFSLGFGGFGGLSGSFFFF